MIPLQSKLAELKKVANGAIDTNSNILVNPNTALKLIESLEIATQALKKIDDPMKYHHWEEDPYTRAGCFQFVAHEALAKIEAMRGGGK